MAIPHPRDIQVAVVDWLDERYPFTKAVDEALYQRVPNFANAFQPPIARETMIAHSSTRTKIVASQVAARATISPMSPRFTEAAATDPAISLACTAIFRRRLDTLFWLCGTER